MKDANEDNQKARNESETELSTDEIKRRLKELGIKTKLRKKEKLIALLKSAETGSK